MKAMILAAGLGTRLRPLTLVRPKPLAPLMGTTVLEFWIERLRGAGCEGIVVNAFQLHEKIVEEVRARDWGIPVEVRVEPFLLGTGGGIRNALDFFDDRPFVVINGDIICDVPVKDAYERHLDSGASVSLLLHDCDAFNNVAVTENGDILGFGQEAFAMARERSDTRLMAFTGIHFIDPRVIDNLPPVAFADILPVYRGCIRNGDPPRAGVAPGLYWREMGSIEAYRALTREFSGLSRGMLLPFRTGEPVCVGAGAGIGDGVRFMGTVVAGSGCVVGEDCVLEDSILWDGVVLEAGSILRNCIVTDGVSVSGLHENEIITGLVGEGGE